MSLLRIQIKNQYKKTLSNPDNTNLLYSNSTNRKETPLCASTTASMTIEAAIALPLFVICILSVIFLFRVLELQQDVEYALQYAARKSAIHAHMTHESGLESVVPIAEAKILFQRKLEELKAPVKEGTTVGEICYLVDGEIWRRERLYAAWTVEAVDLSWCGRQILKRFLVAFP